MDSIPGPVCLRLKFSSLNLLPSDVINISLQKKNIERRMVRLRDVDVFRIYEHLTHYSQMLLPTVLLCLPPWHIAKEFCIREVVILLDVHVFTIM